MSRSHRVGVIVIVLVLAACGGDDSSDPTGTTAVPTTQDADGGDGGSDGGSGGGGGSGDAGAATVTVWAATGGIDDRISVPGIGGTSASDASIGIWTLTPFWLTDSVQRAPSQYRASPSRAGSRYQPGAV